jgi:hypothetical protein
MPQSPFAVYFNFNTKRFYMGFYESYSFPEGCNCPSPFLTLELAHVQNFFDDDDVALLLGYLQQSQSSDRLCLDFSDCFKEFAKKLVKYS